MNSYRYVYEDMDLKSLFSDLLKHHKDDFYDYIETYTSFTQHIDVLKMYFESPNKRGIQSEIARKIGKTRSAVSQLMVFFKRKMRYPQHYFELSLIRAGFYKAVKEIRMLNEENKRLQKKTETYEKFIAKNASTYLLDDEVVLESEKMLLIYENDSFLPLHLLGLPNRIQNILYRAKIRDLKGIVDAYNDRRLLTFPHFGKKQLEKLKTILLAANLISFV